MIFSRKICDDKIIKGKDWKDLNSFKNGNKKITTKIHSALTFISFFY